MNISDIHNGREIDIQKCAVTGRIEITIVEAMEGRKAKIALTYAEAQKVRNSLASFMGGIKPEPLKPVSEIVNRIQAEDAIICSPTSQQLTINPDGSTENMTRPENEKGAQ